MCDVSVPSKALSIDFSFNSMFISTRLQVRSFVSAPIDQRIEGKSSQSIVNVCRLSNHFGESGRNFFVEKSSSRGCRRGNNFFDSNENDEETTFVVQPDIVVVCIVLTLTMQQRPAGEIIAVTALFSVSAFRLIPILSRMLHGLQTVQFGHAAVAAVAADLAESRYQPEGPPACPPVSTGIRFEDVSCQHENSARRALVGVSLFVPAGSVVGVIGDTGAGKSTLVDVLLGLLPPSAGRVLVDGQDIAGRERSWQRRIGYVPQHIALLDDSIRRNIAFGRADQDIDHNAVARAMEAAQLTSFVKQLPRGLDTVIGERGVKLSGGERQRIGLARALYRDPDVLMLDEATSALDSGTETRVMDAIMALRGDKTVVIVAHRLSTVARCDVVFRMQAGSLVAEGTPSGMLA